MFKKVLIAAIAAVMMVVGVQAYYDFNTATINGITWSYTVSGGKACIESAESWSPAISETTSGAITIPSSLGGYPVTSIGDWAFYSCDSLTSVTIGNGVTSIGDRAFYSCDSLTSITIPNSVTSIGDWTFYKCSKLTSVTIPDSVTSIGDSAFDSCSGLTSITIPDSVTSIGDWAFYKCSKLTSVTIPDSVTKIGEGAFYYCSGLTSVTIPDSVTSIGDWAFAYCSSLTSATIGNSVTSIGWSAFSDCSSLKEVHITDVAAWCNINFATYHSNPFLYAEKLYLNGQLVTDLVIPDSVTSIGNRAFASCSSLTSVTIPDSVTSIGWSAFSDCSGLTSVTIGNRVTSIGEDAFSGCSGLTSVTIGNRVTSIGEDAFSGCSSLTSVTIPDSVTSIGDEAFDCCFNLKDIYFLGDAPRIGDYVFYDIAYNYVIWIKKGTYGWDGNYTSTALPSKWYGYKSLSYLPTYTVYYYPNGGKGKTVSQKMTCAANVKLRSNTFTRSGYTFIGWAKSKTGAVAYKNQASVSSLRNSPGTVKLYAVWAKSKYKVAFYANGGKGKMSTQTFTYGKAAKLKKNAFKRTGYTFIGWAKSASLAKKGTVSYKNTQAIKNLTTKGSTIKLYAVWAKTKYKVAFYANGGKGKTVTQTMTYNKSAKLRKNTFTRKGYTFIGWAKSKSLAKQGKVSYTNRKAVKNLTTKGATIKLYAVWKRK